MPKTPQSEVVTRELRFNLSQGDTDSRRRTPQGGLIVDANISRVGVFEYQNADGSMRRELRTPEVVFSKKSLDSFAHAPLTVEHPPSLVDPSTWKQVAVGHVGATVERDGKFVSAELHIQDKATIDRIEKGELRELSCGYQCRLDTTPGTHPEFGDYDAKQVNVFGNHVAIGGKDWGRAGPDVRMKLDSAGADGEHVAIGSYVPAMAAKKGAPTEARADNATETEVETETVTNADSDRLAGENAQLRAENERLTKDARERTKTADAKAEQERIDGLVNAKVALVSRVAPILSKEGEAPYRGDGKSADGIRRDALAVLEPTLKLDGKSEAYVEGTFDSAMARADRVAGGWRELGDVLRPDTREGAPGARSDGRKDEEETVEDAQFGMVAKQKDAWKDAKRTNSRRPDKRDRGAKDARR